MTVLRSRTVCLILVLFMVAVAATVFADSTGTKERTVTKLADGIYEIRHPDAPDTFPQGNTTVVIGEKGVLVVDSCLLPTSAREDIEQIRKWTSKPVTYLVNTHWHFDHTLGNATYAAAFPGIQIVAQQHTAKMITEFNPGAVIRYPTRGDRFKKVLDTGKKPDGTALTAGERRDYERSLAGLAPVVAEFKNVTQLIPNVKFDHNLAIDLGTRQVEIMFLGRGNTAGDTVIYLPNEKIMAVGDLLDHPVPYFFGGFPVDLVSTLQALAQLNADIIVPGHGDVLHDKTYIYQVIDFVKAVNWEVEKELNDGKTVEEVQAALPKAIDLETWRRKFAGTDQDDIDFFNASFDGLVKQSFAQIKMR
jgi:glyoxylase-like metal-dependent hydrolase (beta-lactamase superfamily II)